MATTRPKAAARKKPASAKKPAPKGNGFVYSNPFGHGKETTKYRLLSKEHVKTRNFAGKPVLVVEPEALALLAREAMRDVSFLLRPKHQRQVAAILDDPEASPNDRFMATTLLRNAVVSSKFELPFCQDTGTATVVAWKGQQVWTGADDAAFLSKGIFRTYTGENLRYSQTAPLTMYEEVNTGNNLPAQIDIYATPGQEYKFLFVAKGGGSANKAYLFQETKALLNPASLESFLVEKMKSLGTAACPPYHIAIVVGGTSAEACLKTVKLASTGYYDTLPTTGDKTGRAFRDLELEGKLLDRRAETGPRSAVRRQVLRSRRPCRPAPPPRRVLPGRPRRLLLGRPQCPREDRREGDLARGAGAAPGETPPRPHRREGARWNRPR